MDDLEAKELRTAMDRLRKSGCEVAALLAVIAGDKVALVAGMTPGAIKKGLGADKLLKEVAGVVGGGSGGRAEMAQAGGSKPDKTNEALALARKVLAEALTGS
jgi:alanyl-tRNA synthetase